MQLDLGRLIVRNEFTWHGCKDEDPSAVHLDVLHAEVGLVPLFLCSWFFCISEWVSFVDWFAWCGRFKASMWLLELMGSWEGLW